MSQLVPIFLTIHILTAIAAFGPIFIFPLIARMAAAEPQHGLFALRLTDKIEKRVTIPLALTMPVSGGLLVWSEGINLSGAHWLLTAIALYMVAVSFAVLIQVRTVDRMIELATELAAGRPALAAGPGAALATAATMRAAGRPDPAAEMASLGARAARGGILLTILVVLIVSLMAGKPAI
jgi:hypothetical protein